MRFHEYLMVFRTVMFFVVFIIHGIINCEGIIFSAKWRKPSTSHLVAKRFAMTEEECSAGNCKAEEWIGDGEEANEK